MRKYISTPECELRGSIITSLFDCIRYQAIAPHLDAVLGAYGIQRIDSSGWYPRQMFLDLFAHLTNDGSATTNMVAAGTAMVEHIALPPGVEIHSLPDVLSLLGDIYRVNQRGLPDDDIGCQVEQVAPRNVRLIDYSPYPHDLVYGFLYGLVKRFKPDGAFLVVTRTFANRTQPDADIAIYDITW
jgi:hypothetical protein